MRYTSQSDSTMMRRKAMDPSVILRRQGFALGALTDIGHGSTASSAAAGASAGAAIGSYIPVVGTAIGALVGGAVGAISAAFNRQDKENLNFQQAQNMANQLGANSVLDIQNKYLVLAGLFDLQPNQIKGNIPIYKKYGNKGEYKFVVDMCGVIQQAANNRTITDSDTPQTVYSKVVLPWINSFGFGSMSDSNANMITMILTGMIAEYCANIFTQRWYAVGGDMPFGGLQPFSLPQTQAAAQPVTASPTPSPQVTVNSSPTAGQTPLTELQIYMGGTVPGVGQTVNYGYNGSTFLQLPQPMTYAGRDPATGAWLLGLQGQQYEMSGSTLVPYNPQPVAQTAVPVTPVTATDSSGQSVPAQYIPSGGGGGSYYNTPAPLVSSSVPSTSGISTTEMGIGAALLLGLVYMMTQKKGG